MYCSYGNWFRSGRVAVLDAKQLRAIPSGYSNNYGHPARLRALQLWLVSTGVEERLREPQLHHPQRSFQHGIHSNSGGVPLAIQEDILSIYSRNGFRCFIRLFNTGSETWMSSSKSCPQQRLSGILMVRLPISK